MLRQVRALLIGLVLVALAFGGLAAAGSIAAPAGAAKKPPRKWVKWGKKQGKRVWRQHAKPKPKPKPKPTTTTDDGDTGTTAPIAPDGKYSVVASQGTTLTFELSDGLLLDFALNELDSICPP